LLTYRLFRGQKVSTDWFQSGLPPQMEMVVVLGDWDPILDYLPEFRVKTQIPQMPGWTIYTRSASTTLPQPPTTQTAP
jgi:hypothetical protein